MASAADKGRFPMGNTWRMMRNRRYYDEKIDSSSIGRCACGRSVDRLRRFGFFFSRVGDRFRSGKLSRVGDRFCSGKLGRVGDGFRSGKFGRIGDGFRSGKLGRPGSGRFLYNSGGRGADHGYKCLFSAL